MGHRICDTILDYCDPEQKKILTVIEKLKVLKANDNDDDSDGSDEEDEE